MRDFVRIRARFLRHHSAQAFGRLATAIMNIDTLIWCLLVIPVMSWPVWLVGGVGCVVVWRVSKSWHWLNKFLARTFLVALTIAPAFFGGHPPGFGPAVYIFYYKPPEYWLSSGVVPIFVTWIITLAIGVLTVLLRSKSHRFK